MDNERLLNLFNDVDDDNDDDDTCNPTVVYERYIVVIGQQKIVFTY